jgi:hypothetical protein
MTSRLSARKAEANYAALGYSGVATSSLMRKAP